MIDEQRLYRIGSFAKPHGIKGEISIRFSEEYPDEDDIERPDCLICEIDGLFVPFFTEYERPKARNTSIVKLFQVDTEEIARRLAHKSAYLLLKNIPDSDGRTDSSWHRFLDYTLFNADGSKIGIITDVDTSTINTLFQVMDNEKEILVPAVEEWIIRTDDALRRLHIRTPDGLLD
jgi:16S rRNA processing protein RimM